MNNEHTETGAPLPSSQGDASQGDAPIGNTAAGGDGSAKPRRPRRKRASRRRSVPKPAGATPAGATPAGATPAGAGEQPAGAGGASKAPPAGNVAPPEGRTDGGGAAQTAKPKRPRRRRRSTKGGGARGETGAAEAQAVRPDGADVPSEGAAAPSGEAPARKRRRRSARGRRSAGGAASEGGAPFRSEPGAEAPAPVRGTAPGTTEAGGKLVEAGADRPAPDPEGKPRRRRRGGKRASKSRQGAGQKSADSGGADDGQPTARKKDTKKSVRRKKTDRQPAGGRKSSGRSDGRRSDSRRSDSRRSDGRRRDPRATDIVPRAPSPSEAAKEKILLVNAADQAEARIALLVDGVLEEIYVEASAATRSAAGNIYRGRIQNVERGIGAAFVDIGRGLTGFLHATDVPLKEGEEPGQTVTERLAPGDEVIVQVTRDSIGRKGPALTGRISFPGRYLVLMPFTARSGISRRIPHGPDREHVRKLLRKLEVPEGMGVIVRTASEATDLAALEADLQHLLTSWEFINRKAAEPGQPGLLRSESDLAERSVRDIMPGDVKRVIVDKEELAGQIHRLLRVWYPSAAAAAEEAAHADVRTVAATLDTPLGELRAQAEQEAAVDEARKQMKTEGVSDGPASVGSVSEGSAPGEDGAVSVASAADTEAPEDAFDVFTAEEGAGQEAPPLLEEADTAVASLDGSSPEDADVEDADLDDVDPDDVDPDDADQDDAEPEETKEERLSRLRLMARTMPEVELHTDAIPIFHKYGVETQLEDAFRRSIRLPSGGSIVIDPTEALVAVDVNSGRLTDEEDPESTALVTNLEAVGETARQLRVRDLGGLVVIDFIDMRDRRSRKQVETALGKALSGDRARIRMGRMGPFGLVVLSRQRIRQALSRVTHETCTECGGTGNRRQVSGLGLRIVREMKARIARSHGRGGLEVRAPQEVVSWIKKNASLELKALRRSCSGAITLQADARLANDGWAMKGLPPENEE